MNIPPDQLFKIANSIPLIGWILLTFAPKWRYTQIIIINGIVILLASIYLALAITNLGNPEGNFGSLAGVMKLFENPYAVVAGWIHYLAFDLIIGLFITKNAQKYQINHFLVLPCLAFTLMLGPVGLLLYLAIRTFKTRKYFLLLSE